MGLFAAGCAFTARVHGAPTEGKTGGKREEDEALRKYDKNMNGRLDPDEKASLEADRRKTQNRRQEKQDASRPPGKSGK